MSSACTIDSGRKSSGFSLIELIAIIILLGIISVVALPRIYSTDTAALQSARDSVRAALVTAQQVAMARASADNPVAVDIAPTGLNVTENGSALAGAGGRYSLTFPRGVSVSSGAGTYTFDKLGRTRAGQIVLSRGASSATLRLEASGYAYAP